MPNVVIIQHSRFYRQWLRHKARASDHPMTKGASPEGICLRYRAPMLTNLLKSGINRKSSLSRSRFCLLKVRLGKIPRRCVSKSQNCSMDLSTDNARCKGPVLGDPERRYLIDVASAFGADSTTEAGILLFLGQSMKLSNGCSCKAATARRRIDSVL